MTEQKPVGSDDELDGLFDDIRQTCSDCKHPRCLRVIESARAAIQAYANQRSLQIIKECLTTGDPSVRLDQYRVFLEQGLAPKEEE